jgi:uncharacterized protein (TIGR02996 family)
MRPTFSGHFRADPDNLTIRLAYADWLEERGDPRAEFLRVEAELRQQPDSTPFRQRIYQLRSQIDRDWQAAVDRTKIENCLFHVEYQCPKRWEALKPTDQATVRFCEVWTCIIAIPYWKRDCTSRTTSAWPSTPVSFARRAR